MRTLVLLRHGKSGYPAGIVDHDRPLADRGDREARLAGRWIADHHPPDLVLVSSARRAQETARSAGWAPGTGSARTVSERIYEATVDQLLDLVHDTDPTVATLLIVGHSPGLPGLALRLAGPDSTAGLPEAVTAHFPTAAVAVLTTDSPWAQLHRDGAALRALHIARAGAAE